MTMKKRIDWDDVPLGVYPDGELARRLMITRQAVCFQRKRRGIPAHGVPGSRVPRKSTAVTVFERLDREALDEAIDILTRAETTQLTFKVWSRISLVSGWRAETRHARTSGGDGKDAMAETARGRATAFRFQKGSSVQWTSWMSPRAARQWLLEHGWADEAKARVDELRERGCDAMDEIRT